MGYWMGICVRCPSLELKFAETLHISTQSMSNQTDRPLGTYAKSDEFDLYFFSSGFSDYNHNQPFQASELFGFGHRNPHLPVVSIYSMNININPCSYPRLQYTAMLL